MWNFGIDYFFVHSGFSPIQLVGYFCLFAFYVSELFRFYLFDTHNVIDKETEKTDEFQKVKADRIDSANLDSNNYSSPSASINERAELRC